MPVCDICNKGVEWEDGYVLTTKQVPTSEAYWERAFKGAWSYTHSMDPNGDTVAALVQQQASQSSGWLVCEGCSSLFSFDKAEAKSLARIQNGNPPGVGPASVEAVARAAANVWKRLYGLPPSSIQFTSSPARNGPEAMTSDNAIVKSSDASNGKKVVATNETSGIQSMVRKKLFPIQCEQCNTVFNLDYSLVKEGGTKVRCSICKHLFMAYPPVDLPGKGIDGAIGNKGTSDKEVIDDTAPDISQTPANQQDQSGKPLFLYIPVARLILLSIASMSLYEAYWIYKNWRYIKERDNLNIRPFWRGVFGILFCHSLLRRIHEDKEGHPAKMTTFSPGGLATGWVVLVIIANIMGRAPGVVFGIMSAFVPSFLCLAPVQRYINSVSERRNPAQPYYQWSSGHIVCIIYGIVSWALLMVALSAEI